MACKCGSTRIISVGGKCSDMSSARYGEVKHDGYVPSIKGIGGGDYIQIKVCADCGTLQGFNTDMTDDQIIEALAE